MLDHAELGNPDITLGPLRIWVHGRQFDESQDYWDGNWLRVTAYCSSPSAKVCATGPLLHLSELSAWRDASVELHTALSGTAELATMEPNLSATITIKDGHGDLRVSITDDHLQEQHEFIAEIDQSYLPELIRHIDAVLRKYLLRGTDR